MDKKIIIGGVILILLVGIFFIVFSNSNIGEKISPIQIIKYSDENSSIVITKNNIDKTANIKMELFMESSELQNEFIDLTEFTTNLMCGMMQLAFFDKEGLDELIEEWNSMDGVVENEEGEEIGSPEENILEGYEIKKVEFSLKDKPNKSKFSDCAITGASESEIIVNYY